MITTEQRPAVISTHPARDETWKRDAVCAGHERPDLWFPKSITRSGPRRVGDDGLTDDGLTDDARAAIAICRHGCPVRDACEAYVMATEHPGLPYRDGIWAGLTPEEREQLHSGGSS